MDYGVTMDLQKKSFIEPGESYPHWIKNYIMEGVWLPILEILDCYLKNIIPNMLPNISLIFYFRYGSKWSQVPW